MNKSTARILFLSHGGGPLPLLGDPSHREMVELLPRVAGCIGRPEAIVVISAHWEADCPTVTSSDSPSLIYDYYGFPSESYAIQYRCPGAASLADSIHNVLQKAGIKANLDDQRGLDHGLFVPLKIMYPEANIPCLQLSLVEGLDPAEHIRIGTALAELDLPGLLVIGSGFSFHNMKAFFAPETSASRTKNEAFERWLIDTCSDEEIGEVKRAKKLEQWEQAPAARYCHPREEHLLPLFVCYGMARRACSEYFELEILHKKASFYLW
jgi:4,5-DOPA dioxygenase extradiol